MKTNKHTYPIISHCDLTGRTRIEYATRFEMYQDTTAGEMVLVSVTDKASGMSVTG
jgi:hypothetical protein